MLLCVPWSTRAKDNTRNQPKTLKCLHQSWPLCLGLVSLGSEPGWWIFVCGPHVPSENPQASEWTGTARGFGYSRWIWNQVQKLSFKLNGTAVSLYSQFLKLQREERLGWGRWVESRSQRTHFPYACESWSIQLIIWLVQKWQCRRRLFLLIKIWISTLKLFNRLSHELWYILVCTVLCMLRQLFWLLEVPQISHETEDCNLHIK